MQFLRPAFRQLRAHPGFSALIVLLLALGIGANTAMFSVVHAVLLKPLPYPEPGDLVLVRKSPRDPATQIPGRGEQLPDMEFLGWIEAVPKSFRSLAAYRNGAATLQLGDGAVRVPAASVTGEFFPLLGVAAWRGRLFEQDDLKPGAAPVAVISHSAWQSRLHGDENILGQIVKLDDTACTVIGVLPPSFEFVDPVQFWRPLVIAPGAPGELRIQMVRVFGRLLPGTPMAIAQSELDQLSDRFWNNLTSSLFSRGGGEGAGPARVVRPSPETPPPAGAPTRVVREVAGSPASAAASTATSPSAEPRRVVQGGPGGPGAGRPRLPFADTTAQLVPLQEQLVRQSRTTLWLLLGAVGLVLLIACGNIANLQLARAAARRREIAVRAALGAAPGRIVLELLAENLLLATAGGIVGALFAWWGTRGLEAWLAELLPRINPIGLDPAVLGFSALLALLAGLGFGLAPAWQVRRLDLVETLKEGSHQSSPSGRRWRQLLIAFEVALALVLAVNAGLLVKSIHHLYSTELGYRTADVLTADLSLPRRYADGNRQREFATRWLDALRALPGVRTAALTDVPPLSPYQQMVLTARIEGSSAANASVSAAPPAMAIAAASPDYFAATGIALRQGRFFTEQDAAGAPSVAIVNESFLKTFYPDGKFALGAEIDSPTAGPGGHANQATRAAIVGVVADVRPRGFESSPQAMAWFPLAQQPRARLSAVLQFDGDAAALARAVTTATHRLDTDLALDQPRTLEQQIARQNAPRRVTLFLTGAFAASALLLSALGILGVMSYTVTQRTAEIGIRMALGADAGAIVRWLLRYGGTAVAVGLVAGLGLTVATSRLLQSLLTGVTALDPLVLVAGTGLLALVGLAACLVPARRAARVDPIEALRTE